MLVNTCRKIEGGWNC